ncbi:PBLD [Branchiostoma lanceolatum]|uniref:PBLD protein n=1 Tax=Branchiostoma lanceolatum TaxID=7740 RepID=A0A8J9YML8_BRALA|nr:PBLD [Branchiostoma lanceolatum]
MSDSCKASFNGDVKVTSNIDDVNKSSYNGDVTKSSYNGDAKKSSYNGDVTKSSYNGGVTKSSYNGDVIKTSCNDDLTKLSYNGDVTKSSYNGDVTMTSCNGDVNSNVIGPEERWLPIFQVDAFTDKPFSGNPAAICLVEDRDLTDEEQQKIAAEMNLSETAYLRKLSDEDDFSTGSKFSLRWFTPTKEIDLCGHATLASAATLFYIMGNPSPQLTFQTRSGALFAKRQGDYISLDLPENVPEPQAIVGTTPVQDVLYCSSVGGDLLVRLADDTTRSVLESLQPDMGGMMAAHTEGKLRGVAVTVKGTPDNGCVNAQGVGYDFISRFFSPWYGVPEDPVCGSAHTVLASYWARELGKTDFYVRQCSPRGGDLKVRLREDGRVEVAGKAAVVLKGKIKI